MSETGLGQKAAIEAIGTFILTFIGAGSIIATQGGQLIVIALAHGLALAIAVSAAMNISGGHINPAVTLGMLATKRISLQHAVVYIIAQLVGAIIAGYMLFGVFPNAMGKAVNWGAPGIAASGAFKISVPQAVLFEALMTFILVFAVFGTAVDSRAPKIGGFGIGLAIAMDIMAGGPYTGAAMNPARAMGPMVASLNFANWYVYWIGPIVGGVIAALLYHYVVLKDQA